MTRVLVTGAAGRVGLAVLAELRHRGIEITGLVLSTSDEGTPGETASHGTVSQEAVSEEATLAGSGADRVVVGDARDVGAVREALRDVDAVIHLAAIPSPELATPEEVFCGNTAATFTVLEQAAMAGIGRSVIASSLSVTGLPFARRSLEPPYVPLDEAVPLQVEDPYALSKQVDELTAVMMWRRHGLSVVALRFPFLGDPEERLPWRAEQFARDPGIGVRDLWSYLDYRDAARACLAALDEAPAGCHVVGLAAPVTLCGYPTEYLLDTYLPGVPRRTWFAGRAAPFDLSRAKDLLRFDPVHLWPVEERSAP